MGDQGNLPHQDRLIGAHRYRVTMLPMGRWLRLEGLVVGIAGPALGEALAEARGTLADLGGIDVRDLGGALRAIAQRATPEAQQELLELVADATQVEGEKGFSPLPWSRQITWWPRCMAELGPFVAFALEVQLADFFGGLLTVAGARIAGQPESTSEPDESPTT